MKKSVSALVFMLLFLFLSACAQQPAPLGSPPDPDDVPAALKIELTVELIVQNKANYECGGFLAEDTRSIYYRHPLDKCLVRFDKDSGEQTTLYDRAPSADEDCFISLIQLTENRIFFVDSSGSEVPGERFALYCMDRDGQNLTEVFRCNYNEAIIAEDYIYYINEPYGHLPVLTRYDRITGSKQELCPNTCFYIELIDRGIYFSSLPSEAASHGGLCCYKLDSGEVTSINSSAVTSRPDAHFQLFSFNEQLYFIDSSDYEKKTIGFYDSSQNKAVPITGVSRLPGYDIEHLFFPDQEHFYVSALNPSGQFCLLELKEDEAVLVETLKKTESASYSLAKVNGTLIYYDFFGPMLGYDELNRSVK